MIERIRRLLGWTTDTRPNHLKTGDWGEEVAARFLKKAGYKILGRNVRFGKREELDIVMRNDKVLIFVEVKTRASDETRPAAAVNRAKRQALRRAAKTYMSRLNNRRGLIYRFDIVEVVGTPDTEGEPVIRHLKRAFHIGDRD